jgi:hypothetical protein
MALVGMEHAERVRRRRRYPRRAGRRRHGRRGLGGLVVCVLEAVVNLPVKVRSA